MIANQTLNGQTGRFTATPVGEFGTVDLYRSPSTIHNDTDLSGEGIMKARIKNLAVLLVLSITASASAATWEVPGDFPTIQAAIDSALVLEGDRIMVAPGEHAGALVTKNVHIKGEGGAIINDGPPLFGTLLQGFRLMAGSDGATISHLTFDIEFPVMNGAAVDNVTVTQCTIINTLQGISNWRGSGWEISHNVFNDLRTLCGGGIAILVGDFDNTGKIVENNTVSHNKIMGTLHVSDGDCGGYSGTGIVIFADFRGSRTAFKIQNNRVVKNKISLVSDTPGTVDVVAIELTDTRDGPVNVVTDNSIGFNDLRATVIQIAITPSGLDDANNISRNLGDNRGQGLHPNLFGPGGN